MSGPHVFCAYSDAAFLPRAVAMARSLGEVRPGARLHLLCLDDEARRAAGRLDLPGVVPWSLDEVESLDPEAARAKRDRSLIEYYLTLTPVLPRLVLARDRAAASVTYLDGDLYFYADPEPLFAELGEGSIGVTEHRFCRRLRHCEPLHGRYNDGWVTFRRGEQAAACLDWWRLRCLEWCGNRVEDGKFTEQKYLDQWPALFSGLRELKHPGANVAYWNLPDLTVRPGPLVGGAPLLFFHFSGLRRLVPRVYELLRRDQDFVPRGVSRREIYRPYLAALERAQSSLKAAGWGADFAVSGRDLEPLGALGNWGRALGGLLSGRCAVSPSSGA